MTTALVIIESPGKMVALKAALTAYDPRTKWQVLATRGHLRDLPKKHMGIAVDAGFTIQWVSKNPQFKTALKRALDTADRVYLASDADREGEEIAAAIEACLPKKYPNPVQRLRIRSINEDGVKQAFLALNETDTIDRNLVDAQHARRALDRLFGYTLSPKCWRLLGPGMATGRVQACVLHTLVQHAQKRRKHVPADQTILHVPLSGTTVQAHSETFSREDDGRALLKALTKHAPTPTHRSQQVTEAPPRPCTTATVLRAAGGWHQDPASAQRDLQGLYERGLITYPRTDNATLTSKPFLKAAEAYVTRQDPSWWHGPHAPPSKGKVGTASSEAHEAIRPTNLATTPSNPAMKKLYPSLARMYRHVWATTVASLGHPAVRTDTRVTWACSAGKLHAQFSSYTTRGFHDPSMGLFARAETTLPKELSLALKEARLATHETAPPPHETSSAVLRWMERHGVGRPATYASTIERLNGHKVIWKRGHIGASGRGELLDHFLSGTTQELLDPDFTAKMERDLDRIAVGAKTYEQIVGKHHTWLLAHLPDEGVEGPACPTCNKTTRVKVGKSSAPFGYCGSCKVEHPIAWNRTERPHLFPWSPKRHCPSCKVTVKHTLRTVRGTLFAVCTQCKTQTEHDYL